MPSIPAAIAGEQWRDAVGVWLGALEKYRVSERNALHPTWRKARRAELTARVRERDQLYKDHKFKQLIKRTLGVARSGMGTELLVRDPVTGAPKVLNDPDEIKESETEIMEDWMGLGRSRWLISAGATQVDHPTLVDTPTARERRRCMQTAEPWQGEAH